MHPNGAYIDQVYQEVIIKEQPPSSEQTLTFSTSKACSTLSRMKISKAACPDETPGCVLKVYTEQLAMVFTDIFNLA